MQISEFCKRIQELLEVKTPLIWVHTKEEEIAERAIVKVAAKLNAVDNYYYADNTRSVLMDPVTLRMAQIQGTEDVDDMFGRQANDQTRTEFANTLGLIRAMTEVKESSMVVLRNVSDVARDQTLQRMIYNVTQRQEHKNSVYVPIVMISTSSSVPHMFEDLAISIELPLNNEEENLRMIAPWAVANKIPITKEEALAAARAATGLTTTQVMFAVKDAVNRSGRVMANIINELRVQRVQQSHVLTYVEPKKTLDSIGGHEKLKAWIKETQTCMTPEALQYGVKPAKGYTALGLAGTGKTAIAEAIANSMGVPFIIFDLSRIMGGLVGQSETTAREAFEIINAVGRCVVLIDEADKQFAGASQEGGPSDGGTIARVFDVVLQNLQKNSGQFYILTANDISKLPSPLMRAGRLDTKWFFGFPTENERRMILSVYFNKAHMTVDDDVLSYAVQMTDHFTGAEIETAVNNMVRASFLRGKCPINNVIVLEGINRVSTIYSTNRAEVDELMQFAEQNHIPKTSGEDKITLNEKEQSRFDSMESFLEGVSKGA